MSDDDSWLKPRNFLTGRDDATVFNVSFLSRPAEWHALSVGALTGIITALALAFGVDRLHAILVTVGGGGLVGVGMLRTLRESGHWQDVLREPAYAGGGYLLGLVVGLGIATWLSFLTLGGL